MSVKLSLGDLNFDPYFSTPHELCTCKVTIKAKGEVFFVNHPTRNFHL